MAVKLRKRLGDLLVEEQIISDHDLSAALQRQSQTGRKLGDTLMDMGILSEHQLLDFLARQLHVPLIDLSLTQVDPSAVTLLPEVHARRLRALVIGRVDDTVRVAMSDPADLAAQESVLNLLHQYRVELLIVAEQPLVDAFDRYYRRTSDIASFAERLQAEHGVKLEQHFRAEDDQSAELTVLKLNPSLSENCVRVNAAGTAR